MKINIVVDAADRGAQKGSSVREKIKHGFILLFTPLRADVLFSDEIREDSINLFYGSDRPPVKKEILFLKASEEFSTCIKEAKLPDVSTIEWFEFGGKKLPKLFPVTTGVLEFDIAAATFMLASEFQDLISLDRDEFDRLRAMDSLQDKLGVLDFPVVNYYSFLLKVAVEGFFGVQIELKKYGGVDCGLALTHDVDYTSSLNTRMLRRNFFGHFILNKEKLAPNERGMKLLYPLLAIAGYDPPKHGLKFLRAAEIRHQVKSTFFIKSGATAKQDVKYSLSSGVLKSFFGTLNESGFEIGMHPSMKTYLDESLFVREKRKLEESIGFEVHAVRQHYLKFTAGKTVGIWEKAGIKYDSTLGFSRKAGFRGSVAFPFPFIILRTIQLQM